MRCKGLFLFGLLIAGPAPAQGPVPQEVRAVIDRSRNPRTDYSAFTVQRVTRANESFVEATAEYQQGQRHRVETQLVRVLIDCQTGDAFLYRVEEGRTERQTGGASICGIADAEPILSARMLPPVTGSYGRADVVELIGPDFIRRYAVTEDGILVAQDYVPRRSDVGVEVRTLHVVVRRESPDPAMFEEANLARAYAPAPETLMPRL